MTSVSPEAGAEYRSYRGVLARDVLLPPEHWTFKSDEWYRQILEHVGYEQGNAYIEQIRAEFPHQWAFVKNGALRRLAQRNDQYGQPIQYEYPLLDLTCSPTNFRYLYHALLILKNIEERTTDDYQPAHVIELGGGYGGLAFYVQELAGIFGLELSYTIVDLPEACAMQEAYAEALNYWLRSTVDGTDADSIDAMINETDEQKYLVSAYAFSEFSPEVRDWYTERIVKHCPHGFLVWNINPFYEFTDAEIEVENERPMTGPDNLFVRY